MIDRVRLEREMPAMYVRFYVVGLVLFILPFTRSLFISITTASLVLVIASVFIFDRDRTAGHIIWACLIIISSFLLEYLGVATGEIFGEYSYGRGLAPLYRGTPLIIGFNWAFLIYATHIIAVRSSRRPVVRILCGAALMVVYDVAVEWAAPYMQMWSFATGYPPLKNFVVWFVASLVFHTGFELFPLRHDNLPARWLYAAQIVFFIIIGIYSQIFIR